MLVQPEIEELLRKRVVAGARFLDNESIHGYTWSLLISCSVLSIKCPKHCIIGQISNNNYNISRKVLLGDEAPADELAIRYGFESDPRLKIHSDIQFDILTKYWQEEVFKRHVRYRNEKAAQRAALFLRRNT